MALSRRSLILGAGGAGLALAGAGGVFRVLQMPQNAVAPWGAAQAAVPVRDPRLDAFRHAILAPNPHNRQPWQIRLVGADEALITCDLDRRLPQTDPFDRQITIGFGAFLELARIAGTARGMRVETRLFPEGLPGDRLDARPVARLAFVRDGAVAKDPLFDQIPRRRTNKEAFMEAALAPADLAALLAEPALRGARSGGTLDAGEVARLRDLAMRAAEVEFGTARTFQESVDLMRIGAAEVDAQPDGISLRGPMIEALSATGLLTREEMARPNGRGMSGALDRYRALTSTAKGFVWIVTPTNTRLDQIEAGRLYVRQNLLATARGLAMSPLSQALQEFPEMAGFYRDIHAGLASAGGTVQMFARLGQGREVLPSPRWPLEAKLAAAPVS